VAAHELRVGVGGGTGYEDDPGTGKGMDPVARTVHLEGLGAVGYETEDVGGEGDRRGVSDERVGLRLSPSRGAALLWRHPAQPSTGLGGRRPLRSTTSWREYP